MVQPTQDPHRLRFLLHPHEVGQFRATLAAENAERSQERPGHVPAALVGPPEATTFGGTTTSTMYWQTVRFQDDPAAAWLLIRWQLNRSQPSPKS